MHTILRDIGSEVGNFLSMFRANGADGWRRKRAKQSGEASMCFSGGKVPCFPLQRQIHCLPEIFLGLACSHWPGGSLCLTKDLAAT